MAWLPYEKKETVKKSVNKSLLKKEGLPYEKKD